MFEEAVGEDCGATACRCVCHVGVVHLEAHIYKTELHLDKYTHPNGRCFIRKQPQFSSLAAPPVRLGFEACPPSLDCLLTFFASIGILVMSQLFLAL